MSTRWILAVLLFLILSLLGSAQPVQLGEPPVPTGHVKGAREHTRAANHTEFIDTSNRAAVRSAWEKFLPTADVPIGWNGNHETGEVGDSSLAQKQAAIDRVNFMRAMAGVPSVVMLNLEFSRKAMQAAFMMSKNKGLSHFPPTTWLNYTEEGAEAAQNSNLCLAFNRPPDPGCVLQYMEDSGEFNFAVGHRRWILHPQTQEMGSGEVAQVGEYPYANALWIFDGRTFDPRPETRDGYTAWPPPGFVPNELIFPRWSFAYPDADFSSTTVTVEQNGQQVPVQLEQPSQGFGDNAIVFRPGATNGVGAASEGDIVSKVTLSNVIVDGTPRTFTYEVTAFNPTGAGPPPNFSAAGLVNSASFTAGALTPDSWADLFGENFASQFTLDSSFPTSINGVSLMIADGDGFIHTARLHFVSPNRIQFLSPPNMAPGQGSVTVTNSAGLRFTATIAIAPVRPGLFSANASGKDAAAATYLFIDGAGNRSSGFTFTLDNPRLNAPIDLGSASDSVFLAFFGTGFRHQQSVSCKLGGRDVPVTGAVAQGQFEGLDQLGVGPIPGSLRGTGEAILDCEFDGIRANEVSVEFQ